MPYIGNQPAEQFTSFATQEFSTSATTSYTLDHAVTNENEIALFINNVRQQPGSGKAYTATGTALTLSAATASTDTMYCVFLGRALQTVTPATNSITAAMISDDAVTSAKIADDAVTTAKINNDAVTSAKANFFNADTLAADLGTGLHVKTADSGASANSSSDELVVEGSGTSGISILSGNDSSGVLDFGDDGDNNIGRIIYSHADNDMTFTTNASEHMRLKSGGFLLIKATATTLTNSAQVNFHSGSSEYGLRLNSTNTSGTQYHQSFDRNQSQAGYITSNSATTIAFNNASDQRLKENIQNSGSAIQDLKDIQVRQFDWKDEIDTHRDFGFVAQELVNVVPEAVTQGTDELDENGKPVRSWGVDYSHIVPRLVKVCQEQQTKIEELEARIKTLEDA